jgi:predicted nucleotidyltransferase
MLDPNAHRFQGNGGRLSYPSCAAGATETAARRVWSSGILEAAAGLPSGAGPELAKELGAQGLVRKLQRDTWTMRPAGMTFTAATASKRLTRAAAERSLAAFMQRVVHVNSDPYYLGRVARVVLFGSMLNPDADRPSDVDLAVQVVPRGADWDSHIEQNNERVSDLMTLGHRFRHTIEYAAYWHLEVFRILKSGSRPISLADYNVEKRLILAVPHRMLLGNDEPAPISVEHAPVPRVRRRSRGCPY